MATLTEFVSSGAANANPAARVDWQQESQLYDRRHPRLAVMARLLARLPQRRLLDVGCSTGRLQQLLPPDFEYFGCDLTNHAATVLAADHFLQLDFNRTCDLSHFAGQGIDVVHIGGVLEYLDRPEALLTACRNLVGCRGRLVVSMINFQADRYHRPAQHHHGWIYKPTLGDFRRMLAECGWRVERSLPLLGKGSLRDLLLTGLARVLHLEHPLVRRKARQFIFQVRAVETDGSLREKGVETLSQA